jgi:hypothetical protein
LRIFRAPESELLEEPEDRADSDLPEEFSLLIFGDSDERPADLALCESPSLLMEVPEAAPWPDGLASDSRPMPFSGTRRPLPSEFRSITRLPLSGCTEIFVPTGRRLSVLRLRLMFDRPFKAPGSRSATREAFGALS